MTIHRLDLNGIEMHVLEEGPIDGAPVLLLHGFPDSSHLWRAQIPVLADAGHRVLAPDLRGFGSSSRPAEVERYSLAAVLEDVTALLDHLEVGPTAVVAHDWGSPVGWLLAAGAPDRVTRLAALSVGFPVNPGWNTMAQRAASWYILFFLRPEAEDALRRDDWWLFRAWSRGDGDHERHLADLQRPGALSAALSWYRANVDPGSWGGAPPEMRPVIGCPVLGVWSSGDHYLTEEQMTGSEAACADAWRYVRLEGVSHWIPTDAPERLNPLLVEFLAPDR